MIARVAALFDQLVCPDCRGTLRWTDRFAECASCLRRYPVVEGVPMLLTSSTNEEHDELEHRAATHKSQQSSYFDREAEEEFELTRPSGAPRLYEWLLREKFRRATSRIGSSLAGYTAASVCGGSGMDAQFLAEAGATVMTLDISLGAAKRAAARAGRLGFSIVSIVADVEQLPVRDEAIDIVYVHDGLHHLQRPERGIVEMARVARRWVSISEPARARVTDCAVLVGLALVREEAGNAVRRLRSADIVGVLRGEGFRPVHAERYLMYYKHHPGRVFEIASRAVLFAAAVAAWRLSNLVLGRVGNKLTVLAERTSNPVIDK